VQWSPTVDSATAAGLASTRTYPLRSSFTPTYNMAINLIARFGRERAHGSLESSFAQFQADRAVVSLVRQIKKNESARDELLKALNVIWVILKVMPYYALKIKELEKLLSKRDGRKTFDNRQRHIWKNEIIFVAVCDLTPAIHVTIAKRTPDLRKEQNACTGIGRAYELELRIERTLLQKPLIASVMY
jgi:superfamily II RNA helicase